MAAADAHRPGDVVNGDLMGIVELDVLDGVQHILTAGAGGMDLLFGGLMHQLRQKEIQVAHHGRLVLRLGAAGVEDAQQRLLQRLGPGGVEHQLLFGEGGVLHQLGGISAVESHPVIFPGVVLTGAVARQLARTQQKKVAGAQMMLLPAGAIAAVPVHHQVDEIVVPHRRPPAVQGGAMLQTAVEDRHLHMVGIVLLEGLFVDFRQDKASSPRQNVTLFDKQNYFIRLFNKSPSIVWLFHAFCAFRRL